MSLLSLKWMPMGTMTTATIRRRRTKTIQSQQKLRRISVLLGKPAIRFINPNDFNNKLSESRAIIRTFSRNC